MDARSLANRRGLTVRGPQKLFDSSIAAIGMLHAQRHDVFRKCNDLVFERFWKRALDIEMAKRFERRSRRPMRRSRASLTSSTATAVLPTALRIRGFYKTNPFNNTMRRRARGAGGYCARQRGVIAAERFVSTAGMGSFE
jgi:hypothetical protein